MNRYLRRAGVTNNIRERFLKDAEKGCVEVGMKAGLAQAGMDVELDASPSLKFVGLPFECFGEAKVIENAGPQLSCDAPDHFDGGINMGDQGARFFEQRLEVLFLGQFAANP